MRSQLDKDARRALLDKIAAQRKKGTRHELEDSSSDDGSDGATFAATRAAKPAKGVLASSDEGSDGGERRQAAHRRTAAPGAHRRLLKAAELPLPGGAPPSQPQPHRQASSRYDGGDEDIAAALEQLTIRKPPKPGAGRSTGGGSVAGSSRRPAARAGRSRSTSPPEAEAEPAEAVDDRKCLVLGDKQEFKLNARTTMRLYPHQLEGIRWMWSLYRLRRGGILADDMGLGKTLQCAAFLAGLIESRLIRRAIVVAPKTLLAQWTKELQICGLGGATFEYGGSAGEREHSLDRVVFRRGVLLTTYGMVLHNAEVLGTHASHDPDDGPLWDVMICDEGHKLKNPRMQLRKALDALPCALRIIISGTPIQNNLMEMWALFNFVAPDVLGEPSDFKLQYEKIITLGSDKHATVYERERGAVAAARLRQEIGAYMLRREKKEVFQSQDAAAAGAGSAASSPQSSDGGVAIAGPAGGASRPAAMPHKNDLIVWLKLKPMQKKVYQAFLNSDSVKRVFNQTASALAAITVLKKVCDHPALLSERAAHGIVSGVNRARRQAAARQAGGSSDVEIIEDSEEGEELEDSEEAEWASDSEDYSSDEERQRQRARHAQRKASGKAKAAAAAPAAGLVDSEWDAWASPELEQQLLDEVHTTGFEASCKTVFVMGLLKQLVAEGHRTLVFSQSRVMLNILEAAVKEERWRYCRIDGSVSSAAEREARVRQFQTSPSIPLFLLTSQVGGLGLTLTAADRVIILDPAWNPSTDNQSVDRAYRIGQTRDVVVYRLISCGTVEEKIYRRQVFKGGLSRTGMEEGEQFRYFAQQELRDLFRLEPLECESSKTQRELHAMHAHQRRETPELREHLKFLEKLECFAGVSDHDLLFSKKEGEAQPQQPGSFPKPAATSCSTAAAAASASRAPGSGASPRKGVFAKTATQGWSGSSELSDLFAKRLSIGGGAGGSAAAAAAAQPPGAGWGSQGGAATAAPSALQPCLSGGAPSHERLLEHIEELEEALERKRHLLKLSAGLADGGARVRLQIAELEGDLAAAKRKAAGDSDSRSAMPCSTAVVASSAGGPSGPATLAFVPPLGVSSSAAGTFVAAGAASASSSHELASAAAAALPRTTGSGRPDTDASRAAATAPALAAAAPAAAPPHPTGKPATAAGPAAMPSKPAASPLLARVRNMLFGSSKKAVLPADSSTTAGALAVEGGSRALSFGGQAEPSSGSAGSVIDLSGGDDPSISCTTAASQQTAAGPLPLGGAAQPRQVLAPRAENGGGSDGSRSKDTGGQPAKAQLSRREIKHRLMVTLNAIKEAEGGGYYDRAYVEKLRRRATKLNLRYQEASEEAATAANQPC